ncbi:MAG: hypothetical protein HY791_28620 [Deltaproteobacteria bacterium]|nr:hypothetical protein [Deltaproteobacteria bacterium]
MRSAAFALVLLSTTAASAHDFQVQRSLLLEPSDDELEVLVHLSVPAKKRAVILAFGDANHDGLIDAKEKDSLESLLLVRALAGLELFVNGRKLAIVKPSIKSHFDSDRVEVLVLGRVPFPKLRTTVRVRTKPPGERLDLRVLDAQRRALPTARAKRVDRGFGLSLGAEDSIELSFAAVSP